MISKSLVSAYDVQGYLAVISMSEEFPFPINQYTEGPSSTKVKDTVFWLQKTAIKCGEKIKATLAKIYDLYENAFGSKFLDEESKVKLADTIAELEALMTAKQHKNAILLIDGEVVNFFDMDIKDPSIFENLDKLADVGVDKSVIRKWINIVEVISEHLGVEETSLSALESVLEHLRQYDEKKANIVKIKVASKIDLDDRGTTLLQALKEILNNRDVILKWLEDSSILV